MKNLEGEGARPREKVVFFPPLPSFQQDTTCLGHSSTHSHNPAPAPPCPSQPRSRTLPDLHAYFCRA